MSVEERRSPERFKFPSWAFPIISVILSVIGGMIYDNHNTSIAQKKDIEYILQHLRDIKGERERFRQDLDRLNTAREKSQDEILSAINELIAQRKKR